MRMLESFSRSANSMLPRSPQRTANRHGVREWLLVKRGEPSISPVTLVCCKSGAASLLYVVGQLTHGFGGNYDVLASFSRSFGNLDFAKEFRPRTFHLLP